LQQGERVAISAIAGMAGVGKTELVLQYAHAHWQQQTYPGGVCWLVARELDLGTQVVAFARTYLQLHPPEDLDLHSQVAFCWRHWLPGEVLVVLDDVTNYQEVKPHLPPCEPRFKVLMTTRLQLGAPLERLDLDVLTPEAALDLLKSLIGDVRVEAELEVAKALCEWLGYLPLGLELVGRYLAIEEDLSLAEIQEQLAQARLLDEALVEAQPEMTARLGVASAFELSWKRLDENVQALGYLLSLFALGPIPWSLVESAATLMAAKDLQKARRALVQLNLIKRTQKDTYQLHQLIREFLSAKREQSASADDLKRGFCQAMVAVAKKIPETPALEEIVALNSTIPHLAEVATAQQDWLRDEDLICPFVGLGYFYEGQGAYHQAASWLEQCLSITRNRLGEEHPDVATTLSNLAVPYYFQGRYDQAEPLYVQALALRKRLLGEEHPDVATSLNNLASLYHAQGRYNQAEFLSVQCLALRKQLLGEEHPDVAQSLNNLAMVYHSQGRYDQAEPLLVQALALRKQLLGGEHSGVATSLNNLALLYYFQGKYDQAEPLLVQALALRKRLLGEEHPDVAQSLNNLAKLYHAQGRYNQVEPLFVQALEIAERKLGANHPNTVIFRKNLQKLRDARSS
jgi:tetratricopeptide (TPR) repeat protein